MSLGTILPLCFLERIRGDSFLRTVENYRQKVAASQEGVFLHLLEKMGMIASLGPFRR